MRTLTRERYVPPQARAIQPHGLDAVIYVYERKSLNTGKSTYYAIGYAGKRSKADFHYAYGSPEQREKFVTDWLAALRQRQEEKRAEQQARREWTHDLKVGDVLYGSWGYEQTNPEFYEVTEILGKRVTIRELCCETVPGSEGFMSESLMPCPGHYTSKPALIKIPQRGYQGRTYIRLHECCTLSLWGGQRAYHSWYG